MSDYDELDEMTGSMSDWVNKKNQATSLTPLTPAKNDKLFEARTKVSADPTNPIVESIIELLNVGDDAKAREIANSTDAEAFLNEFIDEYIQHGGQEEGRWIFVRQVQSGKRGKTASVKVELSYDADGDLGRKLVWMHYFPNRLLNQPLHLNPIHRVSRWLLTITHFPIPQMLNRLWIQPRHPKHPKTMPPICLPLWMMTH